ncbi:cation:proton antiporter [Amycolatopsis sp. NPDC051061]|uniref:cation:proton antiporter n=1 Tax=Amycolatopsis sp. NPDC051061 TaxID=3155042 RepID=UPI0034202B46
MLVVASSLILGALFALVIPGLSFAWGVALGAVVSPTDAVATSIIRRTAVSKRVVVMLESESLLNDATALVLLRTAIVAIAASFSFWGALGTFAYAAAVAVLVGWLTGRLALLIRRRITDSTVNTVISFAVPFAASVPAEELHASGLVAAVVAGLVTGIRAPRDLSARDRLSDSQNWRTVELVLEGAVFLTMGLQIRAIIAGVSHDDAGVGSAVLVAVGALILTVAVRAAYVAPLLGFLCLGRRRHQVMQGRMTDIQQRLTTPEGQEEAFAEVNPRGRKRAATQRELDWFSSRITGFSPTSNTSAASRSLARGCHGGLGGHARRGDGGRGADAARGHASAVGARARGVRGRDAFSAPPRRDDRCVAAGARESVAGSGGRRRAGRGRPGAAARGVAAGRGQCPGAGSARGRASER